jgi:serine/threonine protein kinase
LIATHKFGTKIFRTFDDAQREYQGYLVVDKLDPEHKFHPVIAGQPCDYEGPEITPTCGSRPSFSLTLELLRMDLFDALQARKVPLLSLLLALRPLFEGLVTLSKHNYLHGDIKPENIGLDFDEHGNVTRTVFLDWDTLTQTSES